MKRRMEGFDMTCAVSRKNSTDVIDFETKNGARSVWPFHFQQRTSFCIDITVKRETVDANPREKTVEFN